MVFHNVLPCGPLHKTSPFYHGVDGVLSSAERCSGIWLKGIMVLFLTFFPRGMQGASMSASSGEMGRICSQALAKHGDPGTDWIFVRKVTEMGVLQSSCLWL